MFPANHCQANRLIRQRARLALENREDSELTKFAKLLAIGVLLTGAASAPGAMAGVDDLSWMTGSWAGPAGPENTLEENWTAPADGSIASLVRMRGNGSTSMIELIVVEEVDDGLQMHIQQWDAGYQPRPGGAQTMSVTSMGDRTVTFRADSPGGLAGLTYSRPADDTFTIDGETADGAKFQIVLKAL